MIGDPEYKIGRPRQLFTGSVSATCRHWHSADALPCLIWDAQTPSKAASVPAFFVPVQPLGLKSEVWPQRVTRDSRMGRTLYDKLWDEHVVHVEEDGTARALHRPSPGARSDQPAGLRGPAR